MNAAEKSLLADVKVGDLFVGIYASDGLPVNKIPRYVRSQYRPIVTSRQQWMAFYTIKPAKPEAFDYFVKPLHTVQVHHGEGRTWPSSGKMRWNCKVKISRYAARTARSILWWIAMDIPTKTWFLHEHDVRIPLITLSANVSRVLLQIIHCCPGLTCSWYTGWVTKF